VAARIVGAGVQGHHAEGSPCPAARPALRLAGARAPVIESAGRWIIFGQWRLFDVLPVFPLQQVREQREEQEEGNHDETERLALVCTGSPR
jgi:hypothetical protein